jgi:methylmalonyl-CoA carboxyltransferase 12S subunit
MKDSELRSTLEALRATLSDLATRVERLEALATRPEPAAREAAAAPPPEAVPVAPPPEVIPEHIVLALSAAVAAFLGERAHIRTIRLVSSAAWAQQGRVWVQASHRLPR